MHFSSYVRRYYGYKSSDLDGLHSADTEYNYLITVYIQFMMQLIGIYTININNENIIKQFFKIIIS